MVIEQRVRVACQQLAPEIGQAVQNHARATAAIDEALGIGADIVVLPELVTSGYVFADRAEAQAVALAVDAPLFVQWAERLAGTDTVVVAGFAEAGPDGSLYNSAVVLDATGVLAVYRKCHLWDEERLFFSAGTELPPVIDTPHGRVGILICYDLEFPEMTRLLALRGADLVVVPTNWPRSPRPARERPPEMIDASAMARLNRVAVACCDRVGPERGVEWTGGSCVIDVDGWMVAERPGRDEGLVVADVDVRAARDKSLNAHNDVLADRRPELYGRLTAR